jgi:CpeT protein
MPRLILLSVLLPGLMVGLLSASAASHAEDTLEVYIGLRVGSFSSAAQAAADARYGVATWHFAELADGGGETRWLYAENWLGEAEAPYRQRLLRLWRGADGSIIARAYRIPDQQKYIGAWQDVTRLTDIDRDALESVEGCDVTIVRTGEQRFEGQTMGRQCRNDLRGAAFAINQSVVTAEYVSNWDRGFSADGRQVWGPAAGGYRFLRIGAEAPACNQPVRMVVYGTISNRAAFGAYARAIAEAGLYEQNGGYYEAISPALAIFEGEPPTGRGVVISRFPCLEAAQAFWYSDTYQQEIIPLREGIAEFEVLVLPALPIPAEAR